jgi:hypothetical protein
VAHEELVRYLEKQCWVSLPFEVPADINKVSFPNFVATLSVRDIVHILDGVENQIDSTDVEIYNDYKINSNDYITRFLSVLVRMKYKITYESLLDYFIEDYNWFKILNNYVLFARNSAGKVFSINSYVFTFHMTTTDFVYSVTWHTPAFGSNSQVSVKEIADKALRTALSKVKDGKQILVDVIPVGELTIK